VLLTLISIKQEAACSHQQFFQAGLVHLFPIKDIHSVNILTAHKQQA